MIPTKARSSTRRDDGLTGILDLQGKEAVRRILDSGEESALRMSSILPARLVVRQSTGPKGEKGKPRALAQQLRDCASTGCVGVSTSITGKSARKDYPASAYTGAILK